MEDAIDDDGKEKWARAIKLKTKKGKMMNNVCDRPCGWRMAAGKGPSHFYSYNSVEIVGVLDFIFNVYQSH